MEYESDILKRLIDTYGVVGNPRYISEIIKEFIIQGKERYPELFTYQADWLAHIDEFGLNPSYTVSYTGQSIYAPNTLERPVKSAILTGNTKVAVGKNKCNMEKAKLGWIDGTTGKENDNIGVIIPVEVTGTITISNYISTRERYVYEYDVNNNYLGRNSISTDTVTLTLKESTVLIKIGFYNRTLEDIKKLNLQVELGDVATEYEEYKVSLMSVKMPVLTTSNEDGTKTNILTVNEEVELCGIDDVKDTLDLATGELVQRIGSITANDLETSDYFKSEPELENTIQFGMLTRGREKLRAKTNAKSVCNIIPIRAGNDDVFHARVDGGTPYGSFTIWIDKTKLETKDVSGLIKWMRDNNVVIQYELATPIVKTVDFTILDQNGQNVKQLMSFNGGTHFNTGSLEGSPLPSVSVSVETDLEETLKVCSLEGNTM